jgi:hypothetical protein
VKNHVETYVQLRDLKDRINKEAKEKVAQLTAAMDNLEAEMLEEMRRLGVESMRTEAGTAYKTIKRRTPVANWDAALDFIRQHGLWHFLERRVSSGAVTEYMTEHGEVPPGIAIHEEQTVNIRRS